MSSPESYIQSLETDRYQGRCFCCGRSSTFIRKHRSLREGYSCQHCSASLRYRGQAEAIMEAYGGDCDCLESLVKENSFASLRIFEPGLAGPFRKLFDPLQFYRKSFYWPDVEPGKFRDGIQCQNLESLSFDTDSIDLVISSDIMEHVRHPWRAFSEIHRVLKKGGRHIFSIPIQSPMPRHSVERVDTSSEEDVHILPAHYHGDGVGGKSLVYIDYGIDIVDRLASMGYLTVLRKPSENSVEARKLITFITKKI